MARLLKRAALVCIALSVAGLAGCRTETRMLPERTIERPRWIDRPQATPGGRRRFVGVALADNALDEAQGRELALENAAENLLRTIAMDIEQKHTTTRAREGTMHQPGGRPDARDCDLSRSEVAAVVKALRPIEFYREKWYVRESSPGQGFWRYTFFVLAECGEDEYRALVEAFKAKHAEEQ